MAEGFHHLSRGADGLDATRPLRELTYRAIEAGPPRTSNEVAARRYLDGACGTEPERPAFRALRAIESPAWVPALALHEELRSPFGEGSIVRFRQVFRGVRVQGAHAMVELSGDQSLSYLNLEVADETELGETPFPARTDPSTAMRSVEDLVGLPIRWDAGRAGPEIVFVHVPERGFVLCWRLPEAEVLPTAEPVENVGGWESAANRPPRYDFYVDTASRELVLALSRTRSVAPPFLLPVICTGDSEDQSGCRFDGSEAGQEFQMSDPHRHLETHDFTLQPYDLSLPPPSLGDPVSNPTPDWAATNRAAVTATVNAQVVHDFLESLLHRQSIDGQQMSLISVVNCARQNGDTEFPEAYWNGDRMVYGQVRAGGRLVSTATHLDVVAHELCHGLTDHTAALRYQDESGALNESISDILGVIVANRTARGQDTSTWSWDIGKGLGQNGGVLRSLANPPAGDPPQPQRMKDFVVVGHDNGGVHYNSGIHNYAAYLILTATLPDGSAALLPDEVAQLYYFILLQLTDNATFADARKTFIDSVQKRYQVLPDVADRIAAIENAYDTAGIT